MKKLLPATLLILGFLLGASALSAVAGTWTAPTCTPPGCNTEAPINASSSPQTKYGPLTLNFDNLYSIGLKVLGKVQIVDGNQAAGKVLTSDASGIATWQSASGGTSGSGGNITFITPVDLGLTSGAWVTYSGGAVPAGASAVILEGKYSVISPTVGAVTYSASVDARKDSSATTLTLMNSSARLSPSGSAGDRLSIANQGVFPVAADGSFQYSSTVPMSGGTFSLRIVGYIVNGSGSIPGGLMVGGYTNNLNGALLDSWGVGASGACSAAYRTVITADAGGKSGSNDDISRSYACLTK